MQRSAVKDSKGADLDENNAHNTSVKRSEKDIMKLEEESMKKLLTSFLCVMMIVCFMPVTTWANDGESSNDKVTLKQSGSFCLTCTAKFEIFGSTAEQNMNVYSGNLDDILKALADGEFTFLGLNCEIDPSEPYTIDVGCNGVSSTSTTIAKKVIITADQTTGSDSSEDAYVIYNTSSEGIIIQTGDSRLATNSITFEKGLEVQSDAALTLMKRYANSRGQLNCLFNGNMEISGSLLIPGSTIAEDNMQTLTFSDNTSLLVKEGGCATIEYVKLTGGPANAALIQNKGTLTIQGQMTQGQVSSLTSQIEANGTAIENRSGTVNLDAGSIKSAAANRPLIIADGGTLNMVKTPSTYFNPNLYKYVAKMKLTAPSAAPAVVVKSDANVIIDAGEIIMDASNTVPAVDVQSGSLTIKNSSQTYKVVKDGDTFLSPIITSAASGVSAVAVSTGASIEISTDSTATITTVASDANPDKAIDLASGSVVKKGNTSVTVAAEGANYVDNNGIVVLAAGSVSGENTLNEALILPDGTIVQGSDNSAPSYTVDETGGIQVTVPKGGSVTNAAGTTTPMPDGGSVSSTDEATTITPSEHVHVLTKVDRKAPTSTEAGYEAYWKCEDCGKIFSDENGTVEITSPVVIPALGITYYPSAPSVQKPTINASEGANATLDSTGTTATIAVVDGYELVDITVNGVSKGAVDKITGLKTGDVVVVTTKLIEVSDDNASLIEAVKNTRLVARSMYAKAPSGKKSIKVYWYNQDGSELNFDGYEVYRSTKKNSGYGTKPIFKTTKTRYYNTAIKKGTKYYYKVRGYKIVGGEKIYTPYSLKAWRLAK